MGFGTTEITINATLISKYAHMQWLVGLIPFLTMENLLIVIGCAESTTGFTFSTFYDQMCEGSSVGIKFIFF